MFCVKCGVKLADSEKTCPLCGTIVYHPDFQHPNGESSYPKNKMPEIKSGSKALCGAVLIMFLIPIIVCFFADKTIDGKIDWFGYVVGALFCTYVALALPLWFRKPNPVIFVPCNFVAIALYLLYINIAVGGDWFLSFAFPIVGGICIITTTVVTLIKYVKKGLLYILGGAFIALSALMLLIEFLADITFKTAYNGWSHYPFGALFLIGSLLIYFGINSAAREMIKRKLFF